MTMFCLSKGFYIRTIYILTEISGMNWMEGKVCYSSNKDDNTDDIK